MKEVTLVLLFQILVNQLRPMIYHHVYRDGGILLQGMATPVGLMAKESRATNKQTISAYRVVRIHLQPVSDFHRSCQEQCSSFTWWRCSTSGLLRAVRVLSSCAQ